jgi:hypothetical protein
MMRRNDNLKMVVTGTAEIVSQHQIKLKDESEINQEPENNADASNAIQAGNNHSRYQWVNGKVHTNTIESVWSLLKRSIIGSYHKVSVKHFDSYLDELEFRYGNRNNDWAFRDALKKLVSSDKLTYEQLTKTKHGTEKTRDGTKDSPRNQKTVSESSH